MDVHWSAFHHAPYIRVNWLTISVCTPQVRDDIVMEIFDHPLFSCIGCMGSCGVLLKTVRPPTCYRSTSDLKHLGISNASGMSSTLMLTTHRIMSETGHFLCLKVVYSEILNSHQSFCGTLSGPGQTAVSHWRKTTAFLAPLDVSTFS